MFEDIIKTLAKIIELSGIAIIVGGIFLATLNYFKKARQTQITYEAFRRQVGRSILLGLEFLVAGDIISTVAVETTLESVAVLGLIIFIRTFLSFSLEMELEGKLPWKSKD